jgi:IS30 family transposase
MRKYRRITYEDRCQIYALSRRGVSQESIASVLGVSQSTVSREMCRNRVSAAIGSSKRKRKLKHDRRYGVGPAS